MLSEYKAQKGQSVLDVCLNTYGSLDFVCRLIQDSGVSDVHYEVKTGDIFLYDIALTVNPNISRTKVVSAPRYSTYANVTIDAPFN